MNELRFHTQILINPHEIDEELLCYLQDNPEKKTILHKAREFDKNISKALDIEVPEGLHARILLKQAYQQFTLIDTEDSRADLSPVIASATKPVAAKHSDKSVQITGENRRNWASLPSLALVAGLLLLSVVLVFKPLHPALQGEQFVEHILAHIKADPELMSDQQLPQNKEELQRLFASVGAHLEQPLQGMSYAGICDVAGVAGLHLVVQQMGQPVTIIVMPGMQAANQKAFESSGMHGELIPVEGALVAIVGNNMQQVAMTQAYFFKAVRFT